MDGGACATGWPFSSNIARTRPYSEPAMIGSPMRSVPFFTSTVATAPRPFSTLASITTPEASPLRGALSSSTSACSRIASSSLSTPAPVRADTLTNMFCPPHSSAMTSCLDRSEEHTSELQSPCNLVCRLLLEKRKHQTLHTRIRTSCPPPGACLGAPRLFGAVTSFSFLHPPYVASRSRTCRCSLRAVRWSHFH